MIFPLRGPNFQGAQGKPPQKPEKSPDLTHYFSKGAQINQIKNTSEKIKKCPRGGHGP